MTFNNSASSANAITGTYLSQWVKIATNSNVTFVSASIDSGTLTFVCCRCGQSLMVDKVSFGTGMELIPSALMTWVSKHKHRTNDNIRMKIENYIKAALSLSKIKSTYDVAEMSHVFTCRECAPSARTLVVHEDDFIANGGDRLRVPIGLTNWMIDHKHEKSLQEVIADVKPLLNFGQSYKIEKYDDLVSMPTVADPANIAGWAAYKSAFNFAGTTSIKPFLMPKLKPDLGEVRPLKMPKELSSNQVPDTDTLKTFKGRKFRK